MRPLMFFACSAMLGVGIASTAFAENYIGVIVDGYQKECNVRSRGADYDCRDRRLLYAGDIVTKKPDIQSIRIKWAPYASGSFVDRTSLTVVFKPPQDRRGVVQRAKEALNLVKTGHRMSVGATRDLGVIPQPGSNATLMFDETSTFAWENEGAEYILFKDSGGREILRKELGGEFSIQFAPGQIGMIPGGTYVWVVGGAREAWTSTVRVLTSDEARQVTSGLNDIEKETVNKIERVLLKAVYLQFLSDSYPQQLDLYWLSYLLLQGARDEVTTEEDRALVEHLKKNYLVHVKGPM